MYASSRCTDLIVASMAMIASGTAGIYMMTRSPCTITQSNQPVSVKIQLYNVNLSRPINSYQYNLGRNKTDAKFQIYF